MDNQRIQSSLTDCNDGPSDDENGDIKETTKLNAKLMQKLDLLSAFLMSIVGSPMHLINARITDQRMSERWAAERPRRLSKKESSATESTHEIELQDMKTRKKLMSERPFPIATGVEGGQVPHDNLVSLDRRASDDTISSESEQLYSKLSQDGNTVESIDLPSLERLSQ